MYSFKQYTYVSSSPTRVFELLNDQSQIHTWLPHTQSSEVIGGGPLGVGSRLRQVRLHGNKEVIAIVDVVSHESPVRYGVKCSIMGVVATFTFSLEGEEAHTRIVITSAFEGKGLAKMFERLVGEMCANENRTILANLQQVVEREDAVLVAG